MTQLACNAAAVGIFVNVSTAIVLLNRGKILMTEIARAPPSCIQFSTLLGYFMPLSSAVAIRTGPANIDTRHRKKKYTSSPTNLRSICMQDCKVLKHCTSFKNVRIT